jgi:drug/metabolite transporter (DMT)-like permease
VSSRSFFIGGFLALLILDTFAQVCFKLTALHAEPLTLDPPWLLRAFATPWLYGSIAGYLGAFVTWMTLLRHIPVGPAFAASHLEVIGVMVVSIPVFGEVLTWVQYLGAALILAGVLCLANGEPPESAAGENH